MKNKNQLIKTILKAVGLAMGIAVLVLNILNKISSKDSLIMLGLGLTCAGISLLSKE